MLQISLELLCHLSTREFIFAQGELLRLNVESWWIKLLLESKFGVLEYILCS